MDQLDTFIFDCDGVLWNFDHVIDGAPATINKLKQIGKKVIFLSNNSTKTREEYAGKLNKMGFHADAEDVICSAFVSASYLKENNFQGKMYVIGSKGLSGELSKVNIEHFGVGKDLNDWDSFEALDPKVTAVIVGFDRDFSYAKLFKACSYIAKGCLFYATNDDPSMPSPQPGFVVPGTGSIVQSVKVGSGQEPTVFGKPHLATFKVLQSIHHIDPQKTLMVGDRWETDIQFGKQFGMQTAAVLTGILTQQTLDGLRDHEKPNFVFSSVKDIMSFF